MKYNKQQSSLILFPNTSGDQITRTTQKSLVLNNNNYFDITSLYEKGINPHLKKKQNQKKKKKTSQFFMLFSGT